MGGVDGEAGGGLKRKIYQPTGREARITPACNNAKGNTVKSNTREKFVLPANRKHQI